MQKHLLIPILAFFVLFFISKANSNGAIGEAYGDCFGHICVNDEVMDKHGWSGLAHSFDREKGIVFVQMPIDASIHPFFLTSLGKLTRCYQGFCGADLATYRYGQKVRILSLYTNSMARIWFLEDGSTYVAHLDELRLLEK